MLESCIFHPREKNKGFLGDCTLNGAIHPYLSLRTMEKSCGRRKRDAQHSGRQDEVPVLRWNTKKTLEVA